MQRHVINCIDSYFKMDVFESCFNFTKAGLQTSHVKQRLAGILINNTKTTTNHTNMQATSKSPNNQKHYGIETKHQPHTRTSQYSQQLKHTPINSHATPPLGGTKWPITPFKLLPEQALNRRLNARQKIPHWQWRQHGSLLETILYSTIGSMVRRFVLVL